MTEIRTAILALLLCLTNNAIAGEATYIKTNERLHGASVSYLGERAQNGTITLNASNGFFDKGAFTAGGKHDASSAAEQELIHFHYDYLTTSEAKSTGTAHWYLWVSKPGDIRASVYMSVPQEERGMKWQLSLNENSAVVTAQASDESTPQRSNLSFRANSPGRYKIALRKLGNQRAGKTQIHAIQLTGSAITNASLLRARWRPAAIHTQYTSSVCPTTRMWVMESQNISDYSSYSPITTPFGYFGGSFSADRTASGNINFSMWAAGSKASKAPPLSQMPHLLAAGHRSAEFGGFGHEGSGVKIRNWEPLAHHPRSIIQALRMDVDNNYSAFSGYLFDERVNRWVLYAVGRRPHATNGRRKPTSLDDITLKVSSFCEIPGPGSRERTGDRPRSIRRRGWVADSKGRWHAIDRQTSGNRQETQPTNKYIDVDDEGWFVMSTGGLEMLERNRTEVRVSRSRELPAYLQPDIAKQLFEYPATIGDSTVTNITSTSADITWQIPDPGPNATATLYYGPQDCLSFVARTNKHATERKGVIDQVFAKDRTWRHSTSPIQINPGAKTFRLKNLSPETTYYFRLFIRNDNGQIWAFNGGRLRSS